MSMGVLSLGIPHLLILLVAAQRLGELLYARRNDRRLRAAGGVEYGAGHYPLLVGLHTAWLVALFLSVAPGAPILWGPLAVYLLLQGLRVWTLASLGGCWTTRVIVVPGAELVRRGPYRFLRHPNSVIVALEIPVLPLVFGAWPLAVGFGLANLAVLAWRLRVEERALASA
jgi:methyltransferase